MTAKSKADPSRRIVLPPPAPDLDIPVVSARRFDIEQVRKILPQLIDAMTDAVLVVDQQRRVVAANRRYVEVFGPLRGDAAGALCHEALNCPESDQLGEGRGCAACEVMQLKQSRRLLRALADATGQVRRWEVILSPVLDRDDQVTHVVEVWRDITERTQLESQLSHSERLASLGMLAAGVAHEVNNPMASIVAGVESLHRWLERTQGLDEDSAAEIRDILEMLDRETRRTRETTHKLLLLAEPHHVAPAWVDLNQSARDTLALLQYQMRRQGITGVEDLDPALPQLWARGSAMRGMWMNLCMNAIQAMGQGGTLTVRTLRHGGRVHAEVADDGPGIHPAHLERIWDPFFTTKPVGTGTGLGLSITHRIVSRHGGTIRVESAPGEGARFIVELPVEGPGGDHV